MAEERILITKVSPHCRALRFSCDPFDTEEGMFCAKSVRYVRITEKDCAKCKNQLLMGISRADAIERIAKAFVNLYIEIEGTGVTYTAKEAAEAALNALLEGK